MKKLKRTMVELIISLAIPLGIGFLSLLLIEESISIYKDLVKPVFAPPNWIFGPIWTILYILMGIASYQIWKARKSRIQINNALFFYTIQLILNFWWPVLFFRFQMRFLAFIEIILLLLFIILTTRKFKRIDWVGAGLMIPYILWVVFAAVLNISLWILNR
ncbi:TspO/MBR family protein [Geosporobacter ferrireducens]|uniref:TspO protein n=1 Tax=Geosporobacter ferrireducens TaxID=1424294 RepID=A0A1D8GMG4_9FIRM|nr:TspO/MBR family protein [Geosporobacter ferrireducens]AOT72097.1 TspO protein [Geosporobacter ferrireducens]MTI55983.1 tryptophan-rich sensory protein [Geosporobacter ferrireducens]